MVMRSLPRLLRMNTQLEESFSAEELIALASKLSKADKRSVKSFEQRYAFAKILGAASKGSSAEQLPRLIDLFAATDPDVLDKATALELLAAAWISRFLASQHEPPALNLPPVDGAVPERLAHASDELISAWHLFRRASACGRPISQPRWPDGAARLPYPTAHAEVHDILQRAARCR